MFTITPRDALAKALVLVSDPATWTRWSSAQRADGTSVPSYHADATCFCASGALRRACMQPNTYSFSSEVVDFGTELQLSDRLDAECRRRYPGRFCAYDVALIVNVNDEIGRDAVIEIFEAIKAQLDREHHIAILTEARRLIADPKNWTQNRLARNADTTSVDPSVPDACRFCAVGAMIRITDHDAPAGHIVNLLDRAALRLFDTRVVHVNDLLGHRETLRVYDEAIASARLGTLVG